MIGLNVQGLVSWLSQIGFGGLLLFILVGFQQRWWIFPHEVETLSASWEQRMEEVVRDRDEWKQRALIAMHAGERIGQVASAVMGASP
jgi:hypothetical protein